MAPFQALKEDFDMKLYKPIHRPPRSPRPMFYFATVILVVVPMTYVSLGIEAFR
jgi:hypothetical protein